MRQVRRWAGQHCSVFQSMHPSPTTSPPLHTIKNDHAYLLAKVVPFLKHHLAAKARARPGVLRTCSMAAAPDMIKLVRHPKHTPPPHTPPPHAQCNPDAPRRHPPASERGPRGGHSAPSQSYPDPCRCLRNGGVETAREQKERRVGQRVANSNTDRRESHHTNRIRSETQRSRRCRNTARVRAAR